MLKIGIIACAHGNAKAAKQLCKAYKHENVDAIAICGDIGDDYEEINAVLKASKAHVPVIAFPGSHEPAKDYYKAVKKSQAIDGTKKRRITINNYDLITLPGSEVNVHGANFKIATRKNKKELQAHKYKVFLVEELKKLVRKPEKTIILCHDPPKCTTKQGIDLANSGIAQKTILMTKNKKIIEMIFKGQIITQPQASIMANKKMPVKIIKQNVGNKELKNFLKKHKINFLACGHIHESGQKAVNAKCQKLRQGVLSNTVWYNAAPAAKGKGGILIIDKNKGTFKNITVKS